MSSYLNNIIKLTDNDDSKFVLSVHSLDVCCFQVSSSAGIYDCYGSYERYCPYSNAGSYYRLHNLFDQTLSVDKRHFFLAGSRSTTITIALSKELFINKLKIYPIRLFDTKIKVTSFITKLSCITFLIRCFA